MSRPCRRLTFSLSLAIAASSLLTVLAQVGTVAAQEPPACPPNAVVRVIPPTEEEPSTVRVEVEPDIDVKPAADANPDSFHLHYFVDVDPRDLEPGEVIPAGSPNIIHSADTQLDLELASGPHQVWVVLGRLARQACGTSDGDLVVGSTQFTVPAGAGASEIDASNEDDGSSLRPVVVFIVLVVLATGVAIANYRGAFARGRRRGI